MISVILIWGYAIVTSYLIGFAFLSLTPGIKQYGVKREDTYLIAGIAILTVYSQTFSIFYKVGQAANLLLIAVCCLTVWRLRRQLREHLWSVRLTISPLRMLAYALFFLFFAYGTSMGVIHYDTSLYHAQSIRWLEEFGVITGLGNLHSRLAYNSSSFALSALYSFSFLGKQSFHVMAGLLAFLLAKVCLEGIRRRKAVKIGLPDMARLMAGYYLLNIYDEMISPASDYFMVLLFFYIIIRWLDLVDNQESSYIPYALLCVLGVYLVTVKLSAALILLLTLKPAVMMIRRKHGKAIAGFLGLGLLTALPHLARNVIISGWLVYPFTFPDLFDVNWKIPRGMAEYDSREIQVYGRGYRDVAAFDKPFQEWVPSWFASQSSVDQVFILAAASTVVLLILILIYMVVKRRWEMMDFLLPAATVSICFLFWLTSAPLIRYGCVYVWLAPVITYGYLYLKGSPRFDKYIIMYLLLMMIGSYKAVMFGSELVKSATTAYLLVQKDYQEFQTVPYELHGYTFYYAETGDRTGYHDFPAAPVQAQDIFRGDTIEEGFKDVIHMDTAD